MPCAWLLPNANLKVATYPAIANDIVRYVGDIVAVVVAETPYQAYDALDLIDVDYEPLPAVVDPGAGRRSRARRSCTRTSRTTKRSTGRSPAATSTPRSRTPTSSSRNGSSSSG